MNSALDNLYDELLRQADQEPGEEITETEKAKRFLEEKRVAVEKLREASTVVTVLVVLISWCCPGSALA